MSLTTRPLVALTLCTLAACAPEAKPPSPTPTVPVVIGSATAVQGPRALPSAEPYNPSTFTLDGLGLGAPIDAFEMKYAKTLCDADPIDKKMRHVWAHFPAPCRKAEALPDRTLMAIYTSSKRTPPMRVTGIAWLFGNWPQSVGAFPARVGASPDEASAALGASQYLFDITDRSVLQIYRHGEGVYSLVRANVVIGFALGEIGSGPESEAWRGLIANALRYEPLPPTREDEDH